MSTPTKILRGEYVTDVDLIDPLTGEEVTLNVWRNPETKQLFAVDTMELDVNRRYFHDPFVSDVGIQVADTFSGLPK